jgi:hypothetical protein
MIMESGGWRRDIAMSFPLRNRGAEVRRGAGPFDFFKGAGFDSSSSQTGAKPPNSTTSVSD